MILGITDGEERTIHKPHVLALGDMNRSTTGLNPKFIPSDFTLLSATLTGAFGPLILFM